MYRIGVSNAHAKYSLTTLRLLPKKKEFFSLTITHLHDKKHIYTYIYIYIHTYTCICIYMHICAYIYIYIHICTYIYIYVHIYTYIHMQTFDNSCLHGVVVFLRAANKERNLAVFFKFITKFSNVF